MYRQRLHYFDYQGMDTETVEEFEDFVIDNLKPFFDNLEGMGKKIKIPWTFAKNTVRKGGNYNKVFKRLANTFQQPSSNHSKYKDIHQQFIFYTILYEANSFQGVVSKINKYLQELVQEAYTWNKVYYGNYKERTFNVR